MKILQNKKLVALIFAALQVVYKTSYNQIRYYIRNTLALHPYSCELLSDCIFDLLSTTSANRAIAELFHRVNAENYQGCLHEEINLLNCLILVKYI